MYFNSTVLLSRPTQTSASLTFSSTEHFMDFSPLLFLFKRTVHFFLHGHLSKLLFH